MSLPACQQRTLDRIDTALQAREPRLASMFAIFTRLAGQEQTPWWESLQARSWWPPRWLTGRLRVLVLIPLAVVGMAFAVLLCVDLAGMPAGGAQSPPSCRTALAAIPARTCLSKPGSATPLHG